MSQQTESVLNSVLIDMSRSFLQYTAEGWPWVGVGAESVEDQVMVIAERQRQDVADIVALLTEREHFIDFGSFPTEYTDLQFLALENLFESLHSSKAAVLTSLAEGLAAVRAANDSEAAELLAAVETRQKEAAAALKELQQQLNESQASA